MATDLHLVVEEGDSLGRHGCAADDFHVSGRTIISHDVPSDSLFDVVRAWMDNCHKRHKVCAPTPGDDPPLLPNRVIDVTQDGLDPRLIVSDGQRGYYAALSHCWGGLNLLQTRLATLAQYQDSISMDQLPKSFRDAITIARKLRIPFLWIDSLCIVQDSEQDWHHESGLMSSIYRNSMLTISATGAADGSRGCFIPEAHSEIVQLPQTFSDTDGQAYVTGTRQIGTSGPPWADKVASGPLFQRAWALQERSLSRRILHCCTGQWVWECCERLEAQYGYTEDRSNAPDDSKPLLKPILLDRPTDSDLYDFLDVASRNCRYKIWYDLVSSYSGRYLTKSSDKLPAIAGLAATIHEIAQDSYLAGHWRIELERSLFWRTDQEVVSPEPARCRDYRAPSWAWPSVDGGVWWTWPDLSPGMGEEAPLTILDVEVELIAADDNPFGPVGGGKLTVE
ncbi:heterokaryon incompatibility protein-domain-containing protein, partial [Diaporthe sp. PMI_573]